MATYKTSEAQRKAVDKYNNSLTASDVSKSRAKTFIRKYATVDDMQELIDLFNETHIEHI